MDAAIFNFPKRAHKAKGVGDAAGVPPLPAPSLALPGFLLALGERGELHPPGFFGSAWGAGLGFPPPRASVCAELGKCRNK